jgi:hypothetical protein
MGKRPPGQGKPVSKPKADMDTPKIKKLLTNNLNYDYQILT